MLKTDDNLRPLIYALIAIFIVWLLSYVAVYFSMESWGDRGTFGDTFGAINSLFSGGAFAGIIYTILLQRKELQLQREELVQTRTELKRSADAQEKSEAALKEQIKAMSASARLNAMSTLLEYYSKEDDRFIKGLLAESGARAKKKQFAQLIQNVLYNLEK